MLEIVATCISTLGSQNSDGQNSPIVHGLPQRTTQLDDPKMDYT